MNIKNVKEVIKYSQPTQTEEEIIFEEAKKEMKQKEKEIIILRQENIELKNELEKQKNLFFDLQKKTNEKENKFNNKLKDKDEEIKKLKESISKLDLKNNMNKEIMNNMLNYSLFEKIFENEKLTDKILAYLPLDYYLVLASLNKKIHIQLYYKKKYLFFEKKYLAKQKLISEITQSNIPIKYQVDEEEIIKLIKKYTEPHLIPGNPLRYSLFHSLMFLENIVRRPLQEKYDKNKSKKEIGEKAKIILSDIFKVMKIEDNNEITQIMKNNKIQKHLNSKIIHIHKDNFLDLNKIDKNMLKLFNVDEYINIKFEFKSAEDIKTLLIYFLKNGLEKE